METVESEYPEQSSGFDLDDFAADWVSAVESEAARTPGVARTKRGGKATGAARTVAGAGVAGPAAVGGATAKEIKPALEGICNAITKMGGLRPLEEKDIDLLAGGIVPAWNKYADRFADRLPEIAAVGSILIVFGPRVVERQVKETAADIETETAEEF